MKTLSCLVAMASVLAAGCQTIQTVPPPIEKESTVRMDARLLVPCETLSDLASNPSPKDVLTQHRDDTLKYKACADGKQALIDAVHKAFGGLEK